MIVRGAPAHFSSDEERIGAVSGSPPGSEWVEKPGETKQQPPRRNNEANERVPITAVPKLAPKVSQS